MDREEILKQLNGIFKDVLDNKDIEVKEETQPYDVEDWDSLIHLQLAVATEKHFNVRFSLKEIQAWGSVKDILDGIAAKLNS